MFSFKRSPGDPCYWKTILLSLVSSGCDAIGVLASQGFTPSNVRDEPIINPIRVKEEGEISTGKKQKLVSECSDKDDVKIIDKGDREDLLIRGFYEKGTDLIMNFRICDINQPSYQIRKPSVILKYAETVKKILQHLFGAEKTCFPFRCILRRNART